MHFILIHILTHTHILIKHSVCKKKGNNKNVHCIVELITNGVKNDPLGSTRVKTKCQFPRRMKSARFFYRVEFKRVGERFSCCHEERVSQVKAASLMIENDFAWFNSL